MKFSPTSSISHVSVSVLGFLIAIPTAYANPELGGVTTGDVTVTQTAHTTQINQTSEQAILEWKSFNIGSHEKTHFEQPVGGIALNRINPGAGASQIYGSLTSTGKIILVNPAGVYMSSSAFIDVGGLIASTSNISNDNFLKKQYVFDQPSTYSNNAIINNGAIRAAQNGLVALLAGRVENNGYIQASYGTVALGSGTKFTLNFTGDQLINFSVDMPAETAKIVNKGYISANGGRILITAQSAKSVLDNTINMEGVLEARSIGQNKGEILLLANEGTIHIKGKISTDGMSKGSTGGDIKILAQHINVDSYCEASSISAKGDAGGGNILLAYQNSAGQIVNASNLEIYNSRISASALNSGKGGNITLRSDYAYLQGEINARGLGEGGYGGNINIQSHHIKLAEDSRLDARSNLGQGTITITNGASAQNSPYPDSIELANGSTIDASAYGSQGVGGWIKIASDYVLAGGKITSANKTVGGFGGIIDISGSETLQIQSTAKLNVSGNAGGGNIIVGLNPLISPTSSASIDIAKDSVLDASGLGDSGAGGAITVFGRTTSVEGNLLASAKANNGFGGTIKVLALDTVTLASTSQIDVSGSAGGGRIFVGGSHHGAGIEPSAMHTVIEAGSVLNASALTTGAGGDVSIWSNGTTDFAGKILATGGVTSGDGGYVQVAGLTTLNFTGSADVTAPHGNPGTVIKTP